MKDEERIHTCTSRQLVLTYKVAKLDLKCLRVRAMRGMTLLLLLLLLRTRYFITLINLDGHAHQRVHINHQVFMDIPIMLRRIFMLASPYRQADHSQRQRDIHISKSLSRAIMSFFFIAQISYSHGSIPAGSFSIHGLHHWQCIPGRKQRVSMVQH